MSAGRPGAEPVSPGGPNGTRTEALEPREVTLSLLSARAPGATVCPSEVARAVTAADAARSDDDWRDAMPAVHAAVDRLVSEGLIQLSWKGQSLKLRVGPYRIRRSE